MIFVIHETLENDSIFVAKVHSLQIRLVNDARYFWIMIVPETEATELHELDREIADSLWKMAHNLGQKLKIHCDADKINTATIGNIVPQLHCHIVARHSHDAAWPYPIWGQGEIQPLNEATKAARLSVIHSWLGNI